MSCGGLLWGSIALYYGLTYQSFIPFRYAALRGLNMLYFKFSSNFKVVRLFQVFISLMLPFLFQASLGGFAASGFIMLWSVLALVASLSFEKFATSSIWLLLFIAGTLVSYYMKIILPVSDPRYYLIFHYSFLP